MYCTKEILNECAKNVATAQTVGADGVMYATGCAKGLALVCGQGWSKKDRDELEEAILTDICQRAKSMIDKKVRN